MDHMGRRKGVPPINQKAGVTAHKIGELFLGSQADDHPCPRNTRSTPPRYIFRRGDHTDATKPASLTPSPICSHPYDFVQPSTSYELLPESVTGVIESALSWLSGQHWWMWSWMSFRFCTGGSWGGDLSSLTCEATRSHWKCNLPLPCCDLLIIT